MRIQPLVGPCGKLPILIRDDDTNFFTKDHMLESIHSKARDTGFKVSLSVIPSQRGIDYVLCATRSEANWFIVFYSPQGVEHVNVLRQTKWKINSKRPKSIISHR